MEKDEIINFLNGIKNNNTPTPRTRKFDGDFVKSLTDGGMKQEKTMKNTVNKNTIFMELFYV